MFRQAGREERKAQDGNACPACTLHMHHKDIIAYDRPEQIYYLHWQCADLLTNAESEESPDVIPEDSPAAAEESN